MRKQGVAIDEFPLSSTAVTRSIPDNLDWDKMLLPKG
jgi:hypothetical protein